MQNLSSWLLTLKVLNFWKFTSYCSLKPLWSGMWEVVPARTSPTLHPPSPPTCVSIVATSTLRVNIVDVAGPICTKWLSWGWQKTSHLYELFRLVSEFVMVLFLCIALFCSVKVYYYKSLLYTGLPNLYAPWWQTRELKVAGKKVGKSCLCGVLHLMHKSAHDTYTCIQSHKHNVSDTTHKK